jgi:ATP-binding cassette subfamily B protein
MLGRRRFFAAEVNQVSETDCGPATVKCLLQSHGFPVSYGRLRELCRTQVDGSSIDTLRDVLVDSGLEAEQVMMPRDHLQVTEAAPFPSIVVVRLPHGDTHFLVVWRRVGPFVQVMDPARGRYWTTLERFLAIVHQHRQVVPADAWKRWVKGECFLGILKHQARELGISDAVMDGHVADSKATESWRPLAALDAGVRAVGELTRAGVICRGAEATAALSALVSRSDYASADAAGSRIPASLWSALPAPRDANGEEQVTMCGAVLVRVLGRRSSAAKPAAYTRPELERDALAHADEHPLRSVARLIAGRGAVQPTILIALALLIAGTTALEASVLRGLFDLHRWFTVPSQRMTWLATVLALLVTMAFLRALFVSGSLRLGRVLIGDLILAIQRKIPRTVDAYFRSRPVADIADRAHRIAGLSVLPQHGGQLVSAIFSLIAVTIGIAWLDPASAPLAIATAVSAGGLPFLVQWIITERDMRVRTHDATLARLQLDALLGLVPAKAHGAERAMRQEHEAILADWARASDQLRRASLALDSLQSLLTYGMVALLVAVHATRSERAVELLLVYWALQLPQVGSEIAATVRQYAALRNLSARALELLGAAEEPSAAHAAVEPVARTWKRGGVAIDIRNVRVQAAGVTILHDVSIHLGRGEHVAIVGSSGAGKTTLAGILLGWHRPVCGTVEIDGEPLDDAMLAELRPRTAWVDPSVQLWNRAMLDNVLFGTTAGDRAHLHRTLSGTGLWRLVEALPDGLETPLGEGGGSFAGGEGQRVRIARALMRSGASLVILDEPFRGLDRADRERLLALCRSTWRDMTLLMITHDLIETRDFARVLVLDRGRIVEDDSPASLATCRSSRYRELLDAQTTIQTELASRGWKHARMEDGSVIVGTP